MWRIHVLAVATIWTVASVAYSNSFGNRLTYDGFHLVLDDARVRAATSENVGLIWGEEYWYGTSTTGLYRPLTTFSFLFNYAILGNGPNPAGYHWVNFGLHAANILLVYLLAFTLFRQLPVAAAIAGLWGLHPVTVEAVANIAGRADLLAAAGVLGGLLCHIRAGDSISPGRKAVWLAALMSGAAIGIFSKENAITLPALMLVYDLAFRLPGKRPWALQRELLPGYLAVAPPLMLFFVLRAGVLGQIPIIVNPFLENPLTGAGFWAGRMTALKVLAKYLYLLLWPAGLSADYSYNQIPIFSGRFDSWESWKAVGALAIWIAVLVIGIRVWRGNRPMFFFIALFAVTILPTSNLLIRIGSIMAERFLYLPSVGFAGCLAAAVYAASGHLALRWPLAGKAAPPILIAICLVFAVRTYARSGDWSDEKTLWMHDVRVSPRSAKIHANLAEALWQEGSSFHDAATSERETAVSTMQDLPEDRQSALDFVALGICYRERGDAFAARGGDLASQSRFWYGRSLQVLLDAERIARAQYQKIEGAYLSRGKRPPRDYLARIMLERGRTYISIGQPARALEAFAEGRILEPEIVFFAELVRTHETLGDPRRAAIASLEGLIADPVQTSFASKAIALYRRMDSRSCASLADGSGLNISCPAVREDLCTAGWNVFDLYLQSGRSGQAAGIRSNSLDALGCSPRPSIPLPVR
jgi:protein O-mannosyl-transferase